MREEHSNFPRWKKFFSARRVAVAVTTMESNNKRRGTAHDEIVARELLREFIDVARGRGGMLGGGSRTKPPVAGIHRFL